MPRLTAHARRALVQERRQQILTAAASVFADKGFDRATIRDVARAAGVSEGSIYIYFKNKQDLLIHLPRTFVQAPLDAFQAAIVPTASSPPPPDALLEFVARNIVQVVTHNRELVRVLFSSLPTMDEAMRAEYMGDMPAYALGVLETFIRTQQAAGVLRADLDPALTARVFPGMMLFFLLVQEIIQPTDMPRYEYDKVIPAVVNIFLHGVLTERSIRQDVQTQPTTEK